MMMNVNSFYILLWGVILFTCTCCESKVESANHYRSATGDQLLMVEDSTWIVLHSGIGTLCDRFKLLRFDKNNGEVVSVGDLLSTYFVQDTIRYTLDHDSLLVLGPLRFMPYQVPSWDSITIETFYNDKKLKRRKILNDHSVVLNMLCLTLTIPEFEYLDTSLIANKSVQVYTAYKKGNVIGKKAGGTGFFCLGIE